MDKYLWILKDIPAAHRGMFEVDNQAIRRAFQKAQNGTKTLTRSATAGTWYYVLAGELVELFQLESGEWIVREKKNKWNWDPRETFEELRAALIRS
jgi:hypothetical protein